MTFQKNQGILFLREEKKKKRKKQKKRRSLSGDVRAIHVPVSRLLCARVTPPLFDGVRRPPVFTKQAPAASGDARNHAARVVTRFDSSRFVRTWTRRSRDRSCVDKDKFIMPQVPSAVSNMTRDGCCARGERVCARSSLCRCCCCVRASFLKE